MINSINDSIAAFIQRNVSYEVQKAIAINVMVTALQNWNCTIVEAAKYARLLSPTTVIERLSSPCDRG